MRTAIIYDRVNKWGGAERVLLTLHEIYPDASLYTALYSPKKALWAKVFPKVIPSFLQKIPILNKYHELLGAFTPIAFESFDFSEFDLVISVTSEAAKGVITKPGTTHICYCLTPTRYLWSGYEEYLKNLPKELKWIPFYNLFSKPFLIYLKKWDRIAAQRPDYYVAISTAVKERIKIYYGRESEIIYPPVDTQKFEIRNSKFETNPNIQKNTKTKELSNYNLQPNTYYLIVSRLVPYKKVDLVLEAFLQLDENLVVVGTGSEEGKYKSKYKSKNIIFKGFVGERELSDIYSDAKALIFPQEEDFGLTVVEAQSYGIPVIAYKKGGALDTVIDGKTGVFFNEQTASSLKNAILRFKKIRFNKKDLNTNAQRFSKDKFKVKFEKFVRNVI